MLEEKIIEDMLSAIQFHEGRSNSILYAVKWLFIFSVLILIYPAVTEIADSVKGNLEKK